MKKIISLLLILTLLFALVACGGDNTECTEHVDTDPADGICDNCEAELEPVAPGGTPIVPVTPDMFG